MLCQKVRREPDSFNVEAHSPCDLHIYNRESYWNAGASVDHLVQIAISWVIVVIPIAGESKLLKHDCVQSCDDGVRVNLSSDELASHFGKPVEALKVQRRIHSRILFGSNAQRCLSKRYSLVVQCDK